MKKLLAALTILSGSTTLVTNVIGCIPAPEDGWLNKTYDNLEDAFRSLKLTSYTAVNSQIEEVQKLLYFDILSNLIKLKFTDDVNFKYVINSIESLLAIKKITKQDNTLLTAQDLTNPKTLALNVFISFSGRIIKINTCNLNVIEKSLDDQKTVDYLNNYDFTPFLKNSNLPFFIASKIDKFEFLINLMLNLSWGSYFETLLDRDKMNNIKFTNSDTNLELTQEDLNQSKNLKINFNYDYGEIKNQKVGLMITLDKINLDKLPEFIHMDRIEIHGISNAEKINANDVIKINNAITQAVKENFVIDWTIADFSITGTESTVYEGADFSQEKTVYFNITALSDSKVASGILYTQYITVAVSKNNLTLKAITV